MSSGALRIAQNATLMSTPPSHMGGPASTSRLAKAAPEASASRSGSAKRALDARASTMSRC
eukprot:10845600-Lingulodinium_polyedra.AAC.1